MIKLHDIQVDIIFKALHYAAKNEGVTIPDKLECTFKVVAEQNPHDTDVAHTVEIMEHLNEFIMNHDDYSKYFTEEEEED